MKEVKVNAFEELAMDEMMAVDGGVAPVVVFFAGIGAGYVIDGGVKATTGRSCTDWVERGLKSYSKAMNARVPRAVSRSHKR